MSNCLKRRSSTDLDGSANRSLQSVAQVLIFDVSEIVQNFLNDLEHVANDKLRNAKRRTVDQEYSFDLFCFYFVEIVYAFFNVEF